MNPQNSRTTAVTASREKLARAMMRFDEMTHNAIALISTLRREKRDLELRVRELSRLLEQERSNLKQREKLFTSNKGETEQHERELAELQSALALNEEIRTEQFETIQKLEEELTEASKLMEEFTSSTAKSKDKTDVRTLEAKIVQLTSECDTLRGQVEVENGNRASWALKLSEDEAKEAWEMLDVIARKLDRLETASTSTNGQASDPEIFQQS